MNILKKLTLESIKKNKKRSIGTIIGIILSVALICAVAGMFMSLHATLVENAISEGGYYHLKLGNITNETLENVKLNKDVKTIMTMEELGYSEFINTLDEDEFQLIRVYSINKEDFDDLKYTITEGRFPNNKNEIVLSEKVLKNSNHKIGDEIELNIGKRITLDGYELDDSNPLHKDLETIENPKYHKYKIVGTVSRLNRNHILYGFTTDESGDTKEAYLSLKNPRDYKTSISEILGAENYSEVSRRKLDLDYEYNVNSELLRWETMSFSESTTTMIVTVLSVVIGIIIITSVFCIRNSFAISITEKMKMYGMLASVGATKKQIKKSVVYEGMLLGLIGIPLGILSGIFADYVLIKIVNALIGDSLFYGVDGLVFVVSWVPIVASIILGFVTIYLSSITSAIRASKVSPIENLKNSKDVKMTSKKLKTPKWITSIFKTGGELAYKNLKRSKKKYRTTVVSLTVSIFVFIAMNTFINETFKQQAIYYVDYDYNMVINSGFGSNPEKIVKDIRSLDKIDQVYVLYHYDKYSVKVTDSSKINTYEDAGSAARDENGNVFASPSLIAYDDEIFKNFADSIGVSYEDCKDKAILYDTFAYNSQIDGKDKYVRRYKYKRGDVINAEAEDNSFNLTVGAVTDKNVYGYEHSYYDDGIIIVNEKYFNSLELELGSILIESEYPDKVEEDLKKLSSELKVINYDKEAKSERAYVIVISIFLYGFITVISLIGVTNIFNTITANMELRSKEFAILKSVGMTKKEFNRMINLETLFYSTKALMYGIILGLIGSLLLHWAFGLKNETTLEIPYTAIVISIIFVFIIVSIIMKYSIHKINKQNTIETIRQENI